MTMRVDQLHNRGITLKLQISPKPPIRPVSCYKKSAYPRPKCSAASLARLLKVHAAGQYRIVENLPRSTQIRPRKVPNPVDSSGRLTKLLCINKKMIYL